MRDEDADVSDLVVMDIDDHAEQDNGEDGDLAAYDLEEELLRILIEYGALPEQEHDAEEDEIADEMAAAGGNDGRGGRVQYCRPSGPGTPRRGTLLAS